ncbi:MULTISPECIES: hypothetical protein [unclassified Enterococcus]|uniref:hypothetical protein n=1 Tax=unclassified Enterococcus TaxID=2608891 RepID=UPI000A3385D0|nr:MULTISPECIES: hypothetical protein [unclassified Enterococcus]
MQHPDFSRTPQYHEMSLKVELFEMGWTFNEIENTDFNELMKLIAFRDGVKEYQDIKYLDENTMF